MAEVFLLAPENAILTAYEINMGLLHTARDAEIAALEAQFALNLDEASRTVPAEVQEGAAFVGARKRTGGDHPFKGWT